MSDLIGEIDTGIPEADKLIGRLLSDDPDFQDCDDAADYIRKMAIEMKGPDEFATWKDAAIAVRVELRDTLTAFGNWSQG